jgi:hypothetical protein
MNNPEILVTVDTQDIGRKQTKRKKKRSATWTPPQTASEHRSL